MTTPSLDSTHVARSYDRQAARWRAAVDWAKHRPWVLKAISPMARGLGRWRVFDRWFDRSIRVIKPDLSKWSDDPLAACWLGHATMLLRLGGRTLLTDPVFSTRVGLGWGFGTLGPARVVAPACEIRDLPAIDLILISHAHFDHLDRPTLARLPKSSTIVCARGLRDLLDDLNFKRVIELDVGESTSFEPASSDSKGASLRIEAVPLRHWGARTVIDNDRTYCGFLIESTRADQRSQRILFGADTALQSYWKPIGDSGGVDLAIVGIGAYDPWIEGHASPEQAWQMAMDAGARVIAPMHHSTFKLSREPMAEPLQRFLVAAGQRAADVVCRGIGDVWRSRPTGGAASAVAEDAK